MGFRQQAATEMARALKCDVAVDARTASDTALGYQQNN
jgi:hypothetical protein